MAVRHVLFVEGDGDSAPAPVHTMLADDPALDCTRVYWSAAQPEKLPPAPVDLIVGVATAAVRHDVCRAYFQLSAEAHF
jgi:hypothetical protein